ncbi:MAG: FAD-dependent oxidoreductase, partial [Bacteroidota bacterium]
IHHGIDLRPETELEEILDDGNGKVKGIKTKSGEVIDCQFVGLTVGVHPNIDLVKETEVETDRGILVDEFLQTSAEDVYAIGDCAQLKTPPSHRRPIEAVWYAGRMMGETVARTITGNKTTYKPGIWFNSAKFFDIEYQTYGTVPAQLSDKQSDFYWENREEERCMHFVFDSSSFQVLGVNLFGIRSRHEVWDRWLNEKRTLDYVMQHLPEANFDPEFYKHWESEIQAGFNEQFPDKQISRRKKRFLEKVFG